MTATIVPLETPCQQQEKRFHLDNNRHTRALYLRDARCPRRPQSLTRLIVWRVPTVRVDDTAYTP